jgi:hypothetical protein
MGECEEDKREVVAEVEGTTRNSRRRNERRSLLNLQRNYVTWTGIMIIASEQSGSEDFDEPI